MNIVKRAYTASMFTLDNREIRRLEVQLRLFARRAYPFAVRETLTETAKQATLKTKRNMRLELTLRNTFTVNSMLTTFARGLNVNRMEAITGSISPYMPIIEFGGSKSAEGGSQGVVLPTSFSANQGFSANRTRTPQGEKKLSKINLRRGTRKPKTREQATLFAVQDAVSTGQRDVFLDLGRTKGIFRVVGGRAGFKRGWPKGAKLKMIYDLSRNTVRIPATPVMGPAVDEAKRLIPLFYQEALRKQLRRQNLL